MTDIRLQEYTRQIDELIDKGQYDEAVAHLRHILQHYPKFLSAYRLLGKGMLEIGQNDMAEEMFRRTLSGDPEDFVARVGMSVIYDQRGDLRQAIWHLERAFELAPDNEAIQDELRRLYGRRDGVVPSRVMLTHGALARLYLRGGLFSRAVETFRSLLAEEPERVDLWVALAEALWNDGQRVQAEEACLRVLDRLPYCLKANLILGEIWTRSGRDEATLHLRRAEAADPENLYAAQILGEASPIQPREVKIPYLAYGQPEAPVGRPPTPTGVGVPVPEERALVDLEHAADVRIEIPAWLEEIGLGEVEIPSAEEGIGVPEWLIPEEVAPEVSEAPEVPAPAEIPEWLREVAPPEVAPLEPPAPAEIPEWLREVAPPEVAPPEVPAPAEIPEWLREVAPPEVAPPEAPAPAEIPEWLREVAPPEIAPPEVPAPAEIPEWLREVAPPEVPAPAEIPEWLREVAPPEVVAPEAPAPVEIAPPVEPTVTPSWLEEGGLPEGEEALAWLASLAAGKEEELRAAAAAEAEERMAEIMGREVPPREVAPPEVVAPEAPAPVEIAPPAEPTVTPSWLEEGGLPEGEEALAWLASLAAGKEEELRAAAAMEAEERMAEIMGREVPPPPAAVPEAPVPAEIPEWLREVAPPEAAAPEVPVPAEIPEWLQEVAPPEAAAPEVPVPAEIPEWLMEAPPPEVAPPEVSVPVEVPEWLEEAVPPEVPRVEVPPAEPEVFGWTTFGEEVEISAPPPVEAPPPEPSFGWTAFGVEPLAPEVPPEAPTALEIPAAEVAPPPIVPAEEVRAPSAPIPERPRAPIAPAPELPAERLEVVPPVPSEEIRVPLDTLRARVRSRPRDYEAQLALARALWQVHLYDDSLEVYSRLLKAGKFVEEVLTDMEAHVVERPRDVGARRVLGDAYMRVGRLAEALATYREALEQLE